MIKKFGSNLQKTSVVPLPQILLEASDTDRTLEQQLQQKCRCRQQRWGDDNGSNNNDNGNDDDNDDVQTGDKKFDPKIFSQGPKSSFPSSIKNEI